MRDHYDMRQRITSVITHTLGFLFVAFFASSLQANNYVKIMQFKRAPTLDGKDIEWSRIKASKIRLHAVYVGQAGSAKNKSVIDSVSIKGAIYSGDVYFFIEWQDSSYNIVHKPWIWNKDKNKYIRGVQQEDRLAMQFEIEGNYSTNWMAGNYFKADMWHWKASRSNPLGLMHDKSTVISRSKLLRSYKATASDGNPIYILRPSDAGTKLYKTKRYGQYEKDIMPKYILEKLPSGSVADVKAIGVWNNGVWRLEIKRKLNTGNSDDVVFIKGHATKGGIAIFNHSENDRHMISDTLTFQF